MDRNIPVITIDGPSGSGKGTLAQKLAIYLNWNYLDSGALYRILALVANKREISLSDEEKLSSLIEELDIQFFLSTLGLKIIWDKLDISQEIRSEGNAAIASRLATLPVVRQSLLGKQRDFRKLPGLVTDGRDMGTIVFPDAVFKFFLTASPKQRALRRYNQLKEKGISANLTTIEKEVVERDKRDCNRSVSPLRKAENAAIIDSTAMSIDGVFQQVLLEVQKNLSS
ncbi:(d)CMP kinase [Candidatus Nitrosacidococcus tergens]|uniref:Cytidylate kinase n=1 Tax=Candidatus Nitrosacidococcus tergens TaxID=553981 RepID=A0A7G1QAA2_9GAMM|nr:(d)CMP kinase [Candidatus Nitrosacidococcus tergens]CAB1275873.1 cytidylate kinase [Candidatus Nitrosacidococcus tergens]